MAIRGISLFHIDNPVSAGGNRWITFVYLVWPSLPCYASLGVKMSQSLVRIAAALTCVASMALISCSTPRPGAVVGTPEFYWAAAEKTYSAGDYAKTLDDLDQVAATANPYTTRAIAWRLVVTSGMVRGYTDLADRYTLGARINNARALSFRLRATKYQTMAGALALRFAQQTDAFSQVPLGDVPLAFALPRGNAAEPPLLARIGSGIDVSASEQEAAEAVAVERAVLLAVCAAAGAPNDIAKAREILSGGSARATRAAFGDALAQSLTTQALLFARDKLDDPEKAAIIQDRAGRVRVEAARLGSARIGYVVSDATAK